MAAAIISTEIINLFRTVFAGRDDAWGTISGGCVRERVGELNYRKHLDGRISLGLYPLLPDGRTSWVAIDIDKPDYALAQQVQAAYAARGAPAYIERSKSYHFHVWLFFDVPVSAAGARRLAKQVLSDVGLPLSTEIFPKQDRLPPDGVGNYIHLPYYGGEDKRRVFLDAAGQPMPLEAFLQGLERVVLPDVDAIPAPETAMRWPQRNGHREAYSGPPPGCIEAALETPAYPGTRHATGARIAAFFANVKGLEPEAVWDILCAWNARNDPPLEESALRRCLERIEGYAWGCSGLRELEAFAQGCAGGACDFYQYTPEPYTDTAEVTQPLPQAALDERALCAEIVGETGWLYDYVEYARRLTDAPRLFHMISGMAALAAAMGNRMHTVGFGGSWVFPHLWLCFVAPSGLYRKSTAVRIARDILIRACPNIMLSSDASREQWLVELSEKPDRMLLADEFAGLLESWQNKYMHGTKELFTILYDVTHYTRSIRSEKDSVEIVNPAITVLAASTADWLKQTIKPTDLRSGFLARMLFIQSSQSEPHVRRRLKDPQVYDSLVLRLQRIAHYQGEIRFDAVDDEYDTWLQKFEGRYRSYIPKEVVGLVSRAGLSVQKVAMLLHVAATQPEPGAANPLFSVTGESLRRAIRFVEWAIDAQKKLIEDDLALTPFDVSRQKVIEALRTHDGEMTRSELLRACRWSAKDFEQVIQTVIEMGDVESATMTRDGARKPYTTYRLGKNAL